MPTLCPEFYEFISIIVKKGRFEYLLNSLLLFRDLYRFEKGIVEVQVESANSLTDNELNTIDSIIQSHFNKKTELTVTCRALRLHFQFIGLVFVLCGG